MSIGSINNSCNPSWWNKCSGAWVHSLVAAATLSNVSSMSTPVACTSLCANCKLSKSVKTRFPIPTERSRILVCCFAGVNCSIKYTNKKPILSGVSWWLGCRCSVCPPFNRSSWASLRRSSAVKGICSNFL